MSEPNRTSILMPFLIRISGVIVVNTYWLIDGARRHDWSRVMAAVGFGYVLLPYLTYLYSRYRSRRPPPRYSQFIGNAVVKWSKKSR